MRGIRYILFVLFIVSLCVALYLTFYYTGECKTYECFKEAMRECKKASYINEEPEASWKYEIEGLNNNECEIRVYLLQAKKGELELDRLNGYDMLCKYEKGIAAYPEKNLEMCSGKLKEEIQGILIKKLHTYIIANLGELNENLKQPFSSVNNTVSNSTGISSS